MGGFILLVVAWIRWEWCSRKTEGTPLWPPILRGLEGIPPAFDSKKKGTAIIMVTVI